MTKRKKKCCTNFSIEHTVVCLSFSQELAGCVFPLFLDFLFYLKTINYLEIVKYLTKGRPPLNALINDLPRRDLEFRHSFLFLLLSSLPFHCHSLLRPAAAAAAAASAEPSPAALPRTAAAPSVCEWNGNCPRRISSEFCTSSVSRNTRARGEISQRKKVGDINSGDEEEEEGLQEYDVGDSWKMRVEKLDDFAS